MASADRRRPSKRQAILEAANRVVIEQGVASLTLEAVARAAGISKGGLLHHFRSKEALIQSMLIAHLEAFEAELGRRSTSEEGPGKWLRAFVEATFDPEPSWLPLEAGFLAAVMWDPALLDPMRARYAAWQEQALADGIDPDTALLVRLAADGLWFAELFGFAPPSGQLRKEVQAAILRLIGNSEQSCDLGRITPLGSDPREEAKSNAKS